jgi:hypothetical protein
MNTTINHVINQSKNEEIKVPEGYFLLIHT